MKSIELTSRITSLYSARNLVKSVKLDKAPHNVFQILDKVSLSKKTTTLNPKVILYNRYGISKCQIRSYSTSNQSQSIKVDGVENNKMKRTAINPTRSKNYSEWYQKVIAAADLAEHSDVRGCMIIKPWGYSIWENIKGILDSNLKKIGCSNVYFPLLIPLSYLEKESSHVEGFAKECAVVTHRRLENDGKGKLIPASPLKEPLVIRPTSETIIGESFAKWIKSYNDLPLVINQWANVMRWEMRPRLFLRNTEFLWQEGHTVHASSREAHNQTVKVLDLYEDFLQNVLAIDVVKGKKTSNEKFPGALDTYTLEAMMQDGKSLQIATSHFLGQNFSKSHGIVFSNQEQEKEFGWTTSWGVSTRLIGGIIMSHSDDNGLVLPPKIAPHQIVILQISKDNDVVKYCEALKDSLSKTIFGDNNIRVHIDINDDNKQIGKSLWHWIKKGVPIVVQVGKKEVSGQFVKYIDRTSYDLLSNSISNQEFISSSPILLNNIHNSLLKNSRDLLNSNNHYIYDLTKFIEHFRDISSNSFVTCFSEDSKDMEEVIKPLGVSARCIIDSGEELGNCIFTGIKTNKKIIFAKSY